MAVLEKNEPLLRRRLQASGFRFQVFLLKPVACNLDPHKVHSFRKPL